MTTKLSFAEFDSKLKSGKLSSVEYRRHLQVDPVADIIRIRFKPGALRDSPPPGYDVDREVYFAQRAHQGRTLFLLPRVGQKRVLAEGDSWFKLPPVIFPEAVGDRLNSDHLVQVDNIGMWGATLAYMLEKHEYLSEIPKYNPDWFIFSGGGNDLQQSLVRRELLRDYEASRPIDQCLSDTGIALLRQIAGGYRTLLNQISVIAPTLHSICYSYDYPRPTFEEGKYIGQYLKRMSYPKNTWDAVTKVMIDRLTDSIEPVVRAFPLSLFLDCRGVTASFPFINDMHPGSEGFKALAHKFERAMGVMIAAIDRVSRETSLAKPGSGRDRNARKSQRSDGKAVTVRGGKTASGRRPRAKRPK